jgi:hypothetical protein
MDIAPAEQRSAKVNVDNLDSSTLLHVIQSFYKSGFDSLMITYTKNEIDNFKTGRKESVIEHVDKVTRRLHKFNVLEQKEGEITIGYAEALPLYDVEEIFRQIIDSIIAMSNAILIRSKVDKSALNDAREQHDIITKHIAYCLRVLNKKRDSRMTHFFFHIVATIDNVLDILKYAAQDLNKNINPVIYDFLQVNHRGLELLRATFIEPNKMLDAFVEFSSIRRKKGKELKAVIFKFSEEESLLLGKINGIQEIVLDLMEARVTAIL